MLEIGLFIGAGNRRMGAQARRTGDLLAGEFNTDALAALTDLPYGDGRYENRLPLQPVRRIDHKIADGPCYAIEKQGSDTTYFTVDCKQGVADKIL